MRLPLALSLALLVNGALGNVLSIRNVTVGGLTKAPVAGQALSFVDLTSTPGANGDFYAVQLQIQNTGSAAVPVAAVDVQLYVGSFAARVPAGAATLTVDTTGANTNLPTLAPGASWPNNGLAFSLPTSDFPDTTACTPYDVTLALNTTYTANATSGVQATEQDLVPMRLTPTCLNQAATAGGAQAAVTVTPASKFVESSDAALAFFIDFGGKVLEPNPLNLFNITGSNRTDVVYSVDQGLVYLLVYPPDAARSANITVTVPAGAATNANGLLTGPASASIQYKPKTGVIRDVAVALTAVFAGVVAASWATSFTVSCMQPYSTAGSLGYGALGFVLWAQKLFLTGLLATPALPSNYRTLASTFAWADFQAQLPWFWGKSGGGGGDSSLYRANTTTPSTVFESNAAIVIAASTYDFSYYMGPAGSISPPPPPPPPSPLPPNLPPPSPAASAPAPALTNVLPGLTLSPPSPISPGAAPPTAGAVPAHDSCSVFQNSDFYGGDINGTNFQSTDPQECCNACLSNPLCFVWTLSLVQNQCYLKAASGWQQRSNMTCCLSGTANHGGVSTFIPGTGMAGPPTAGAPSPSPPAAGGGPSPSPPAAGGGPSPSPPGSQPPPSPYASSPPSPYYQSPPPGSSPSTCTGTKKQIRKCKKRQQQNNGGRRRLSSRARRLLSTLPDDEHFGAGDTGDTGLGNDGRRALRQAANATASPTLAPAVPAVAPTLAPTAQTRFVVVSTAAGALSLPSTPLVVVKDTDAWAKAKYVIAAGNPADPLAAGSAGDVYTGIKQLGFWLGCVLGAVLLLTAACLLLVSCCQGEVPGVLHAPRMPLMVVMLALSSMAHVGAALFSGGYGIVPLCVGVALVVCGPLVFVLAAYIGVVATVYRKRRAVYLLSQRAAAEDPAAQSRWERYVVAGWGGMSLNRGKWRPVDPSRKNEFVFRWGPLFEDCRGPLHQRRKIAPNVPPPSLSLRRVHASSASDVSSQSGAPEASPAHQSGSSRRKVVAMEEKPMAVCCTHKVRRSGFQAFGVVVSLARLCAYALVVGALGRWPVVQAGVLLLLSVLYLVYLRVVVPYSRHEEMWMEYFVATADVVLFVLLLLLAARGAAAAVASIDSLGLGLIVVQCLEFVVYLINRVWITYQAFSEVVCACGRAPSPKKHGRRRRGGSNGSAIGAGAGISREDSVSMSVTSDPAGRPPSYTGDDKPYFEHVGAADGKGDKELGANGHGPYRAPAAMPSPARSARSPGPGMFPAIAEETESQMGSPALLSLQAPAPSGADAGGPHAAARTEAALSQSAARLAALQYDGASPELPHGDGRPGVKGHGQQDVFAKFWKSL